MLSCFMETCYCTRKRVTRKGKTHSSNIANKVNYQYHHYPYRTCKYIQTYTSKLTTMKQMQ